LSSECENEGVKNKMIV